MRIRESLVFMLLAALIPAASPPAAWPVAAVAGPAPSRAAPPTGWVTVSGPVHSSAQPDLARLGSQLQVVWSQTDPGSTRSVRTRLLAADGSIASAIYPVVTGWPAILNDPQVIGPAATRRTVFGGIHPDPFSSYTGPAVFAESSNGTTWNLGTGSLSKSTASGSGGYIAAIDVAGTPFFAKGGFSGGVIVHRGVDPTVPATADDLHATETNGAPIEVALARDRANNNVYVAWYSLSGSPDSQAGTFVQQIWPQPNGTLRKAPGSSNGNAQSIGPDQPVALAERVGGGVWVAYLVGYPTSKTIRMWRVGSPTYLTLSSGTKTASHLCLTPSTDGRLWLTYRTVSDHVLHAVRTNKAATKFGPVQDIVQPLGLQTSVNLTACEGSRGPLSLVVNATPPTSETFIYARNVLPPLSASPRPAKLNNGKVTVTVTDVGDPVAGAKVKFQKKTYTTNAKGKAVVVVSKNVKAKRYTIKITKAGYSPTSVKVKVL